MLVLDTGHAGRLTTGVLMRRVLRKSAIAERGGGVRPRGGDPTVGGARARGDDGRSVARDVLDDLDAGVPGGSDRQVVAAVGDRDRALEDGDVLAVVALDGGLEDVLGRLARGRHQDLGVLEADEVEQQRVDAGVGVADERHAVAGAGLQLLPDHRQAGGELRGASDAQVEDRRQREGRGGDRDHLQELAAGHAAALEQRLERELLQRLLGLETVHVGIGLGRQALVVLAGRVLLSRRLGRGLGLGVRSIHAVLLVRVGGRVSWCEGDGGAHGGPRS
jgi:hypothetical protein